MTKFDIFLSQLERGEIRAANKEGSEWIANAEVKQQILEVFSGSELIDMPGGFRDKEALTTRVFKAEDKVRMVPGGTSVRRGAYIAPSVVIMPPSYINIGAYIDEGTMVDSHVLVGSCAQIGKGVHLSTAVQIGGVLEPVGSCPVIVEDHTFIGAGVILTEGIIVRERAVLAPGVMLSASVPIYDMVNNTILRGEIPSGAVVVPGSRTVIGNEWAKEQGISLSCAVVVKYRDEKTASSVILETVLR